MARCGQRVGFLWEDDFSTKATPMLQRFTKRLDVLCARRVVLIVGAVGCVCLLAWRNITLRGCLRLFRLCNWWLRFRDDASETWCCCVHFPYPDANRRVACASRVFGLLVRVSTGLRAVRIPHGHGRHPGPNCCGLEAPRR